MSLSLWFFVATLLQLSQADLREAIASEFLSLGVVGSDCDVIEKVGLLTCAP